MYDKGIMKGAFFDDTDWMSTLREDVSPEEAYRRWTEDDGYDSIGTYGVVVEHADSLGLPCVDDAAKLAVSDHASVVFEDLPTEGRKKVAARKLRNAATDLGPLYEPEK